MQKQQSLRAYNNLFLSVFLPFAYGYLLTCIFRSVNAVQAPYIVSSLHISIRNLGWLTSAYFLAFALTQFKLKTSNYDRARYIIGAVLMGYIVQITDQLGYSISSIIIILAILSVTIQITILFRIDNPYLSWFLYVVFIQASMLSYAALSNYFPKKTAAKL